MASCTGDESQLSEPAVLAMQGFGEEIRKVELYDSGTAEEATATIQFRVEAESISSNMLNITLKVNPSKVEEYNKTYGTDYELAPASCYDLSESNLMMPRYNTISSTATVTINASGIPDAKIYLLPRSIDKINGDESAEINEDKNVVYVTVQRFTLKTPELLDRSNWEVIFCDSEKPEKMYNGYPYGPIKYMFDGEPKSWWNYAEPKEGGKGAPFTFVIDLKQETWIKAIRMTARPDTGDNYEKLTRNAPRSVDFAFATEINSDDPTDGNYTEYEVFKDLAQFQSRLIWTADIILEGLYKCRYIKCRYNEGWPTTNLGEPEYLSDPTAKAYKGAVVAEFNMLGYTDTPYEE